MLNDQGDKYEGQDDSEYHFSDEEVSYEVEPEPGPSKPSGGGDGPKENLLSRMSRSRRMIISGVVFIVLVFIVYKMVAPTTSVPSTNITPEAVATAQPVGSHPTQAPATQPGQAVSGVVPNPAAALPQQPVPQPQQPIAQAPLPQQPVAAPPVAQQMMPQQPPMPAQQTVQTVANMPSVIPVQSQATYNVNQPATTVTTSLTPVVNAGAQTLSATSQAAYNQFQAEYAQRLNDFSMQNKALQDQLNTLNARVANMETQLHQLVQALTHQGGAQQEVPSHPPVVSQGVENKLAYSVQAIIPGRAWLRSDSGETVTVAEGDMIKELGRVAKIDPYDGVVVINTGTKMLSLSYGNGG